MIDNVSFGALIRAAVVVSAEVNIDLPILELFPGQGQRMTAAVAKEYSTKQIIPMHPGRTAMFCPDFCVAGADGQNGRNETATQKIYAMPKTDSQDLAY